MSQENKKVEQIGNEAKSTELSEQDLDKAAGGRVNSELENVVSDSSALGS